MSNFFSLVTELETLLEQLNTILAGSESETVEVNGVTKDSISKAIKDHFSAIQAMVKGHLTYATKAEMDAAGAPLNGELAEVWNDSTGENNGLYGWNGTWIKSPYTIQNIIDQANTTTPVTGKAVADKVNGFRSGYIHSLSGNISIDTENKTISSDGQVYVVYLNEYYAVDAFESKPYIDGGNSSSIHYLVYTGSTIEIVFFSRITEYDLNTVVLLGVLGREPVINGDVIFNGELRSANGTVNKAESTGHTEKSVVVPLYGYLSIDTVNKTILNTGDFLVAVKNSEGLSYIRISEGDINKPWDNGVGSESALKYILFNKKTKDFAVVYYGNADAYSDYNLIGTINKFQERWIVNADGILLVDGIEYGNNKRDTTTASKVIKQYGPSLIGALDYQGFNTDYSHIIMYGQSLSMGWDSESALTTTNYPGTYMMGDRVWVEDGNNGQLAFNPLISTVAGLVGESPIVAATNSFKLLFDRHHRDGGKVSFLATNCGDGSETIETLSKECTNGTNFYVERYIKAINRAKTIANNESKSISCPAIIYMQGESNYQTNNGKGLVPETHSTSDKDEYKALLNTLKNNMQADVMETYGQTKVPLFYIYQTAVSGNKEQTIANAQAEFAEENADVIMLNPVYPVADHGLHLTSNGSRWYGELIGKALVNSHLHGISDNTLKAKSLVIEDYNVYIECRVPVSPIVIDEYTNNIMAAKGFTIYKEGLPITIDSVEVVGGNGIKLETSTNLTGLIEVGYRGGNIRDSDNWQSLYRYFDDSSLKQPRYNPLDEEGNPLYNKNYPCQNWLEHFFLSITV
ncbi:hypothetical protein H5159_15125 [Pseudoalteromonas sp. SG43-1]|uniref:sialate O-acetylesterase n=1 Tax=Pseudoalteromonas sp. SG43-1 TaxID=2760971 RepID=UPI0016012E8A|nr:sialate O-acetylesterase [Pseudoalteromonas sp. SG43-1]MBB1452377.1 hypothetical protein [Pseudoalteromonas sp. SG43-1]